MRNLIFKSLSSFKFHRFLASYQRNRQKIPILAFHRVDQTYDIFSQPILPGRFEALMLQLKKDYRFYPLSALRSIDDPRACFITFDDATHDFYQYVYPILKRCQIPATLFVPAQSVDEQILVWNNSIFGLLLHAKNNSHKVKINDKDIAVKACGLKEALALIAALSNNPDSISARISELKTQLKPIENNFGQPMTWEQIKEVHDNGIEIGNHGYRHFAFNKLSATDAKEDLTKAHDLISTHVSPPHAFAYPMGAVGHQQICEQMYELLFTTQTRHFVNWDQLIPRISVYDQFFEESLFRIAGLHSKFH